MSHSLQAAERASLNHKTSIRTNLWEALNEVVYIGFSSRGNDFVHWDISAVVSTGNVVSDAGVKQGWLLRYYTHLPSHPLDV